MRPVCSKQATQACIVDACRSEKTKGIHDVGDTCMRETHSVLFLQPIPSITTRVCCW